MTNEEMKNAFAAQLVSANLDRAGIIEQAATMIADLTAKLTAQEKRNDALDTLLAEALHLCDVMARASDFWDEEEPKAYARENAEKMLANDKRGTQKAKRAIFEKWSKWHKENPNRYEDNTDFAEAMLQEHKDTLQSVKKITDWCGKLSKEAVISAWKALKSNPANNTSPEDFAKLMKKQIKTLKPHVVIRWCESYDESSNPAR